VGAIPQVLVDGRVIDHPTAGSRGIGRYTVSLVGALRMAGAGITVLVDTPQQETAWRSAVADVDVARMNPGVFRAASSDTWFLCTQLMLHPIPLDVIPRAVTEARMRVMAVMYDVIPQRWPERYLIDEAALRMSQLRIMLARTVDRFLAISTFTANTAAVELGVPIEHFSIIGSAVDPRFAPAIGDGAHAGSGDGVVIANTGPDDRKNTERLIRAWSLIPASSRAGLHLDVVCSIPDDVRRRWTALIDELGLADVRVRGALSDTELVAAYRTCTLAVFPSLEEGFGLPVAEAAACGAPVVCSDTSSMPEVIGAADALFNPHDAHDMARVIERAVTDAEYRTLLVDIARACANRWTWSRVGDDAVRAFAGNRAISAAGQRTAWRPRVAVVGRPDPLVSDAWPDDSDVVVVDDVSGTDVSGGPHGAWGWGRYTRGHDFDAVVTRRGPGAQLATDVKLADDPGHIWLSAGASVPEYVSRASSVIVESSDMAADVVRIVGDAVLVRVLSATDPGERVAEVARLVLSGVES